MHQAKPLGWNRAHHGTGLPVSEPCLSSLSPGTQHPHRDIAEVPRNESKWPEDTRKACEQAKEQPQCQLPGSVENPWGGSPAFTHFPLFAGVSSVWQLWLHAGWRKTDPPQLFSGSSAT